MDYNFFALTERQKRKMTIELAMNLQAGRAGTPLSLRDVEKYGFVTKSELQRYEAGQSIPDVFILTQLSAIYEVDLIDLLPKETLEFNESVEEALNVAETND